MKKINTSILMFRQSGFTLIELMLAIVLGLIITAAAAQLLLTSQTSLNLQRASAEVQDSGDFGLKYLIKDIQLANLGASDTIVTDKVLYGGVVLAQTNLSLIDKDKITKSENGPSNSTTLQSDQLTIQYQAMQTGFDCTGTGITQDEVDNNVYIVQRYFLREDENKNNNEPNKPLVLACASAHYKPGDSKLNWRNSQIIIRRVDHFHVLLGVATGKTMNNLNNMHYVSIKDYMVLGENKPRIISIQLGFIIRSYENVGLSNVIDNNSTIQLLDQSLTLKNDNNDNKKFIRESIVQTIALRNGQGVDSR